ncbi:hypothetical protein KJS94_02265 [Flavihumibacter rivuli]|uniref:tetratricopeptide repeat protein n=1 Tax=Flavihumibacter rivuli TaxID=2838156 RepID=UPI001BDDF33B|nr:hypothetical protein [Flavihumibacter rivuli]ULQ57020.1 hypothetical protein KJS94_02265 [Flavihumibacter rivuli]
MKPFLFLPLVIMLSLTAFFFSPANHRPEGSPQTLESIRLKKLRAPGCTPDWKQLDIGQLAEEMIPLPGTGTWKWQVSTSNDSAQFYFNQGINLYYGFHIVESVPSFRKAQSFDPQCAMAYWGEALALGPNINDVGYTASIEAYTAAQKAASLSGNASAKEKALIEAMLVRYSKDSAANQANLNEGYTGAMKAVYTRFEKDPDIASLYADAQMLLHPWDYWNHDGSPRAWTPQLVSLLEKILKAHPNHPGASHYYIHAVEASPNPGRATQTADRLVGLAPGLSHMVHMPSHIYIRTGNYSKGITVNTMALEAYEQYKKLYPLVETKADLYDIHNRHMQSACAINQDDYAKAREIAFQTRNSFSADWLLFPGFAYYIQYMYMSPEIIMIAFQQWDEIIRQPDVDTAYHYANLLQHFAKGISYAKKGELSSAAASLEHLERMMKVPDLAIPIGPMNAPLSGASVAQALLKGCIEESRGNLAGAIASYKEAVTREDAMIYTEPKDWLLPARHFLADAYIRQQQWKVAEKTFRDDLAINPGNRYSLAGLNRVKQQSGR